MTVALAFLLAAQDWPEFRGPTAQGTSTASGLPVEWGPEKNVAWKVEVPGHGWSSPVVHAGRVHLTSAVPIEGSRDHSLAALCLDLETGAALWRTDVFRQDGGSAPPIHARNSHASPTPIVRDGRLYVHFGHQGTACLDLAGKVLWRAESPKLDPEDGNGASPLLVDGALVFSQDGKDLAFVRALDRDSGKEVWRTPRRTAAKNLFSYCTPLLVEADGRRQVVLPGSGAACAYDPATGTELWRVDMGQGYSVVPRPVFAHGLVYVCTGFDKPSLLAVRPGGAGDVTATHVAWRTDRDVPLVSSIVVLGDLLYMVSDKGVASCLDARTGEERWRERLGGQHWASPLAADGKVYFQNVDGVGFVVRAAPAFELLSKNALDGKTLASYAVTGRALLVRTDRHLYRIQAP